MQSDSKLKESIKSVSLGMLSNYNNHIDYNVYIPILNELISNTLEQLPISEKIKKFGTIKLIDSSTISMAKTYFQWAEFRSTKAGIKLHTKFNLKDRKSTRLNSSHANISYAVFCLKKITTTRLLS